MAALATFAVSALHLSQLHQGDAAWPVELLGHHASIPLAFAILYQDYPFALADLFLKRALTLVALVAMAFVCVVIIGAAIPDVAGLDPRVVGVFVTASVAVALLYPMVRNRVTWFVDSIVLRRPDYRALRATIARRGQAVDEVPALLDGTCNALEPALSSKKVEWHKLGATRLDEIAGRLILYGDDARGVVPSTGDAFVAGAC